MSNLNDFQEQEAGAGDGEGDDEDVQLLRLQLREVSLKPASHWWWISPTLVMVLVKQLSLCMSLVDWWSNLVVVGSTFALVLVVDRVSQKDNFLRVGKA